MLRRFFCICREILFIKRNMDFPCISKINFNSGMLSLDDFLQAVNNNPVNQFITRD